MRHRDRRARRRAGIPKDDLNDIGKNLVAKMLKGGGFDIVNLGVDVSLESFVDAVRTRKPDILALSALLTTTTPMMQETIAALENSVLRGGVAIIVGGAPVSRTFAEKIGSDGYAADAGGALKLINYRIKLIAACWLNERTINAG